MPTADFFDLLRAEGADPAHADQMTLYDRLLGDWSLEAVDYDLPGGERRSRGEVHFAWVLEGRAIQDVWIVPARAARTRDLPRAGNRYGTTLRVFDPTADAWRITWINPVSGATNHLVGRSVGEDIVQEGRNDDGALIRWTFSEITPRSFHWKGESSRDGKSWRLETEFFGKRTP